MKRLKSTTPACVATAELSGTKQVQRSVASRYLHQVCRVSGFGGGSKKLKSEEAKVTASKASLIDMSTRGQYEGAGRGKIG